MIIIARILLVYFALGAFIPKGDFSQLLHLNDLMEHYEEHKAEAEAFGGTINFYEFLYIHFVEGHDDVDHENLPFQSFSTSLIFYIASVQYNSHHLLEYNVDALPFYHSLIEEEYTFDIFHPPSLT